MLDIGNNQFLVLLFMVKTQFHKLQPVFREVGCPQEFVHMLIDAAAIRLHFGQRGPRKCITKGFFRLRSDRVVIGVEKVSKLRMARPVAFQMRREHKGLEEPTGMGQVPFHRTGIGHGLDGAVFCR